MLKVHNSRLFLLLVVQHYYIEKNRKIINFNLNSFNPSCWGQAQTLATHPIGVRGL